MVQAIMVDVQSCLRKRPADSLLMVDLLEADTRPTFVLHAADFHSTVDVIHPCYINPALHNHPHAQEELLFRPRDRSALQDFANWAYNQDGNSKSIYQYCSIDWHCTRVSDEWLVIGATAESVSSRPCVAHFEYVNYPDWKHSEDLDWTKTMKLDLLPVHVQHLRSTDWTETNFGPIAQWPIELRVIFNTMMRSKSPVMLQWGENASTIYNEAFIPIAGEKQAAKDREVKASERRFEHLIDNSVAAICISRPDGSLSYVNKRWTELYGDTEADRESMAWLSRIHSEDLGAAVQYFGDVVSGVKREEIEIRLNQVWRDPSIPSMSMPYTTVLVSGYAEVGEDGSVQYLTGASIDISHQKWIQGESQRRASEATDAKRRQDAFTDMVAHEIRNPLNAIMQCSDVIQEAMKVLQKTEYDQLRVSESLENAETISHCAAHQKKIVNDLLTLSKLDSDLLSFTPVSSRPEKILQQAIKMFESGSKQHDITLTYRLDPTVEQQKIDWMLIDADRTLQVLINLITNAMKFTSKRPARRVTVTLRAATDHRAFASNHGIRFFPTKRTRPSGNHSEEDVFLLFAVEDTGRGISTAEETRLFHRFSQASLRTHVDFGGSGLGLWISRELTEMQGGEIGFVPEKQDGSLFAFYIRTQHTEPPEATRSSTDLSIRAGKDVNSLERRLSQASSTITPCVSQNDTQNSRTIDLSTITILLTEDNLVNQKVMKKQLARHCKKVLVANHGQEALEILETARHQVDTSCSSIKVNGDHDKISDTEDVDLILMDIEMPVMNGVECTSLIRKLECSGAFKKRIPIIAISANARVEQINEYKEAGMDEVLSKPFLIKDLLAVVKRLL